MDMMSLFAGQQWKHRHREQTYGWGRGRKEVGSMERVAWKHIHYIFKTDSQWELAL